MGRVEAGLAGVLCEQNDLDSAHRFAAQAVEKTKLWKNPNNVAFAYIMLARVLHARGDPQGALERLQNAEQVSQEYPILPSLVRLIEKYKVRLWLSQPDSRAGLSTAERWAQESGVSELEEKETFSEGQEFRLTALAQTLIAKHKTDRALHLLSRLAESALAGGRTSTLIEILALQALALQAQGDRVQAIVAIEHALGLAAPGGYVRVFVDQGKPMGVLLRQSMSCDVDQDYVARLLAAFEATDQQSGGVDGPAFERRATPVHSFALVEPLSKREVDVLRMLKTELTGPEIAHELVISLNTVRTHTKNIYGKLGVNSRRQAVARAESLGLL
jgi:LuxR family maltose regulon positive regulatory protein